MRAILALLATSFFMLNASAELYQGIKPYSSLREVKQKFPKATIGKVDAVWVTEEDGFFQMSGVGLPGIAYLAFVDSRPDFKKRRANIENKLTETLKLPDSQAKDDEIKRLEEAKSFFDSLSTESDDDALTISWIRWVPSSPIPVERYISKFGNPTKTDFKDDTMQPYSVWAQKGLSVNLSDDRKMVTSVEFSFTPLERYTECRARFGSKANCKN